MRMLSQVATVMRGSVGGVTYTANQFKAIIQRARVAPVQPNTQAQSRIKAAFSTAAALWPQQIQAVRDAWDDYASSLTYEGPLGTYTLPGRQVFMSNIGWMKYLLNRGVSFTTQELTAPTNQGFLGIGDVTFTPPSSGETGFTVTIQNPNFEDIIAVTYRSVAFGKARNRYKGPFETQTLTATPVEAASSANFSYTGLELGSIYFISLRFIVDDGAKRISHIAYYRQEALAGV